MQIGTVIGQATATVKHASFKGWKLLIVQLEGVAGKPDGEPVLAIDNLGAGAGSRVILSSDGADTRKMMGCKDSPARFHVMGIADE